MPGAVAPVRAPARVAGNDHWRCGRVRLRRRCGGSGPTLLKIGETLFEIAHTIACTDRDHQTCDCDDGERQYQQYCQNNFHNGLPIRVPWADASRLRVRTKVGCGRLWSGSKDLDVFFLMWREPHAAGAGIAVPLLTDCVCGRLPNQQRNNGIFQRQVWISQEPHNELNRTTSGTNLLPSINHAQMSRRSVHDERSTAAALRAGVGW